MFRLAEPRRWLRAARTGAAGRNRERRGSPGRDRGVPRGGPAGSAGPVRRVRGRHVVGCGLPQRGVLRLVRRRRDTRAVLVAYAEFESVLVLRTEDNVTVESLQRNESPTHAPVHELPRPAAGLAGRGERLAGRSGPGRRVAAGCPRPVRRPQAARLRPADTLGLGEFWVAVRDRQRGRRAHPDPVRYRDVACGRMPITVTNGYLSVALASPGLLCTRSDEARRELTRRLARAANRNGPRSIALRGPLFGTVQEFSRRPGSGCCSAAPPRSRPGPRWTGRCRRRTGPGSGWSGRSAR